MRVSPLPSFFILASFMTLIIGCGGEDGSTGEAASLAWDPADAETTYTVHYGKNSSGELGSCDYEHSVDVVEPFATVTGLDYSTLYYFAVSAYDNYNGLRSTCSEEVSKLTPGLYIGDPPVKLSK